LSHPVWQLLRNGGGELSSESPRVILGYLSVRLVDSAFVFG
jgi:hypothetical protein